MISCLSGRSQISPGLFQLCCTSPLRLSSKPLTPLLSLESDPQSLSLSIQPPLSAAGMQTNISGWGVLVSVDLCGEFSSFCLPSTCCLLHSPLKFQSTPHPAHREVSEWVETSSFSAPSLRWKFLFQCLFFSFSFSYIFVLSHSVEFSLPFRKSGTFCQNLGVL